MNKVTNEEIISKYKETRNIWKTAKVLNISGQTVSRRLKKVGFKLFNKIPISKDEEKEIIDYYSRNNENGKLNLVELSIKINRPVNSICKYAKKLGLTTYKRKMSSDKYRKLAEFRDKSFIEKGHPKGMKGKTHTKENKDKLGRYSKERWDNMTKEVKEEFLCNMETKKIEKYGTLAPKRIKCTWKSDWRTIGGKKKFFRSKWEANYARYLEFLKNNGDIKEWFHEPETFWFDGIKRGCVSYLPDFKVINNDFSIEYHEVKGWMDDRSKTKLNRMRIYHPEIKLVLINSKVYKDLDKKISKIIDGWE